MLELPPLMVDLLAAQGARAMEVEQHVLHISQAIGRAAGRAASGDTIGCVCPQWGPRLRPQGRSRTGHECCPLCRVRCITNATICKHPIAGTPDTSHHELCR